MADQPKPINTAVAPKPYAAEKNAGQQAPPPNKNLDLRVIPTIVKHMTLAIYDHKFGGNDGGAARSGLNSQDGTRTSKAPQRSSNFEDAFMIARGKLVEYRHLTPGSLNGPVGKIILTGSGRQLDAQHRREAGGGQKTKRFDQLYTKFLSPKPAAVAEKRGGA